MGAQRSAGPQHQNRADIQGLRALAVIAVVLYHADVPYISGGFVGVDFFFVLSGFLITLLLIRELDTHGRISLRDFWARRARRLLPAASVVLIATTVVANRVLPLLDRKPVSLDIVFSSVFSANWRFAQQQTDYLAADRDPSPVLHYWSLGVEEQFYAVWPLLIVAVAFAAHLLWRKKPRDESAIRTRLLVTAFTLVFVSSLVYCIVETTRNQPYAFFGTPSRAWQLAAGALLALAVPVVARIGAGTRMSLGGVGLLLFGASAFLLKESGSVAGQHYPSFLAMGPTVAAVLLVAAGTGSDTALSRLIGCWPLQRIGDVSYSFYLWHWPVLVLGTMWHGGGGVRFKLALIAAAFVLSIVTYAWLENPLRRARPLVRRPALSMALGAVLVLAVVPGTRALAQVHQVGQIRAAAADGGDLITVTPALAAVAAETSPVEDAGCQVDYDVDVVPGLAACTFGDKTSAHRVFVLGDSIGGSLFPAVERAASDRGLSVTIWTKRGCPIADVTRWGPDHARWFTQCDAYRQRVLDRLTKIKPELVFLGMSRGSTSRVKDRSTGQKLTGAAAVDATVAGLERTIATLQRAGIKVALIEPPNRTPTETVSCLAEKKSVDACAFKPEAAPDVAKVVAARSPSIAYVRINDRICHGAACLPVVDKVVVYRDVLHFTTAFALTYAARFGTAMDGAAGTA